MKIFTIISFFVLSVSPVLSEENIKNSIESDEIEYLNETDKLKALGSVKITRENYQLEADEVSFDQKNNIIDTVPMKRMGSEQDIVDAAIYLSEAEYVTGQILNIDGGRSL